MLNFYNVYTTCNVKYFFFVPDIYSLKDLYKASRFFLHPPFTRYNMPTSFSFLLYDRLSNPWSYVLLIYTKPTLNSSWWNRSDEIVTLHCKHLTLAFHNSSDTPLSTGKSDSDSSNIHLSHFNGG